MSQPVSLDGQRPFLATPDPHRYFAASAAEEARRRIERCIRREEGPALLVGGAGSGKSLLLHVLARQFQEQVSVALLLGAQLCTRRALLQMILFELGLSYRAMDEGELRLAILRFLRPEEGPQRRLLLLVDEADALPARLLEELRGLTNLVAQGRPLVQLVLAGGTRLEERFAEPEFDAFSQRLAARCYLAPFTREETARYVRAQLAAVGLDPATLLAADCADAMHAATDGVPRLVNQLGNQLFWNAAAEGAQLLDAARVQEAWSDLQQLPAPWNVESAAAAGSHAGDEVVEFGDFNEGLTDEDEDAEGDEFGGGDDDFDSGDDDDAPASIPFEPLRAGRRYEDGAGREGTTEWASPADDETSLGEEPAAASPAVDEGAAPIAASPTPNPFAEAFAEEEVVIDPYVTYEARMYASTSPVVNRLDRSFATQLGCTEAFAPAPESDDWTQVESPAPAETPQTTSAATAAGTSAAAITAPASSSPSANRPDDEFDTELDWEDERQLADAAASLPAATEPTLHEPPHWGQVSAGAQRDADEGPREGDWNESRRAVRIDGPGAGVAARGDVLVIEDDGGPQPKVVPSRQFRRLFSALEAGVPLPTRS